jgi:hypothetical protein
LLGLTKETSSRVRNPVYPLDVVDKLEEATMPLVNAYMTKKIAAGRNNKCTLENAVVRREWFVSRARGVTGSQLRH